MKNILHPLEEIYQGYKNLTFQNPLIEKIAKDRYNICNKCNLFNLINKRCKVCGCWMPAKVRSPKSKCPPSVGKWGAISDNQLKNN